MGGGRKGLLWLLWTGRGVSEGAPVSPWPGALGGWEHRLPCPSPHARPGVPSSPALLPGLPDEAFESLTQLQHIYVAHNKVRHPPEPPPQTRPGLGQGHIAQSAEGTAQGWKGTTRTSMLCSHSSQWPPSFCPVPSESQIWLRTK